MAFSKLLDGKSEIKQQGFELALSAWIGKGKPLLKIDVINQQRYKDRLCNV